MANVYAIRIHELADDCRRRVIDFCESISGSYVLARETDAARVHYQGWIRTDWKSPRLRSRLKKAFPECIGNKGYSLSCVKNEEAYARYTLKGTKETMADVVCYSGIKIDEEHLAKEHRIYWSRAEKPGKSNRSLVEEVHEWAVETARKKEIGRHDIARRICETQAERRKPINVMYVRGVTNTVQWLLSMESQEIILEEIVNRY